MSNPSSRGRICIQCTGLFPALVPGSGGYVGGLESQQAIVLRGLQARGFETVAVCCGHGQPERVEVDGISVRRAYEPDEGMPIIRFLHPRLSGTVRALYDADADIYMVQGSGIWAGVTYDVARLRGKRFVFLAAHNDDVDGKLPLQTRPHERWWYRRALRGASLVLTQTAFQRHRLIAAFGRDSTVVANPMPIPPISIDAGQAGPILWVATFKTSKRPEWVVEAARRIPDQRFIMYGVVPPEGAQTWERISAAAQEIPNLEVHAEPVNHRLDEVYRRACLFVHASASEGLPNTFLEAWARGVPGVTAFDPDGVIGREGLGEVVSDLDGFVAAIRAWVTDPARRRMAGIRAREYTNRIHSESTVLDRLAGLLDPLVAQSRSR